MAKRKQKIDWRIIATAIIGLVVIECFAMSNGINGTFRMIITALIAAMAGVAIPTPKQIGGK